MKTLNEKQWGEFIISDLFEIKSVRGLPADNYKKGTEPYITTSAENNGLTDFVATDGTPVSAKNAISIDPIKGKAFFHSYDFIGRGFSGASINLLYNKNLNRHTGLFVCLTIEMISRNKASYGNLFNSYRLRNGKIRLPIDDNGNPDWEFMSNYMKMHEKKLINRYEKYLNRLKTATKQVNGVVQQRGHEGAHIQLPLRALHGDGDGVGDVRLAALAHLPLMRAVGKAVGAAQLGQIVFGQINGMRLQRGQARLGGLIQRRIGKVLTAGAAVWRQIAFFVVHGVRFNHPHRMCANKKSALKALVPGCGVQETFFSISSPTWPAAISRSAVTLGRLDDSSLGACP